MGKCKCGKKSCPKCNPSINRISKPNANGLINKKQISNHYMKFDEACIETLTNILLHEGYGYKDSCILAEGLLDRFKKSAVPKGKKTYTSDEVDRLMSIDNQRPEGYKKKKLSTKAKVGMGAVGVAAVATGALIERNKYKAWKNKNLKKRQDVTYKQWKKMGSPLNEAESTYINEYLDLYLTENFDYIIEGFFNKIGNAAKNAVSKVKSKKTIGGHLNNSADNIEKASKSFSDATDKSMKDINQTTGDIAHMVHRVRNSTDKINKDNAKKVAAVGIGGTAALVGGVKIGKAIVTAKNKKKYQAWKAKDPHRREFIGFKQWVDMGKPLNEEDNLFIEGYFDALTNN